MLALLLAAPTLALLPRHYTLRSRPTAFAPRAPPLVAQETSRLRQALPKRDDIDREIMGMALPSIANFAVIPLVGAVDTMWVGRMGSALALAGQGAAGQCFFSTYFLIAFIPTITAPLVAAAAGSGDIEGACKRVCEALFLANALGVLGACCPCCAPRLDPYPNPNLNPYPNPHSHPHPNQARCCSCSALRRFSRSSCLPARLPRRKPLATCASAHSRSSRRSSPPSDSHALRASNACPALPARPAPPARPRQLPVRASRAVSSL